MKKRAASLLLALCMILTLLPATAGAVNTETKQVVVMGTDVTAGGYWFVNTYGLLTETTADDDWNVAFSLTSGSVGTLTLKNANLQSPPRQNRIPTPTPPFMPVSRPMAG